MLVMTLSTPPTPGSSVTAVLVFPGTPQAALFMYLHCLCPNNVPYLQRPIVTPQASLFLYLHCLCPNNVPHLQRTVIVFGPPVILHVTLCSQLDVAELRSGQVVTCIPESGHSMLLCTARNANRAASFASAQVNRYQVSLTPTLQCLLNSVQTNVK